MFEWLNDVMGWIGDLVPEWDLLLLTDAAIKFKPGGKTVVLTPGNIYWYWPATSMVSIIPAKRQPLSFNQRLTTKDDVTISANIVVIFEIEDVYKALVETTDFDDTIEEVAQKLTIQPIMSRDFEEIRKDMAESNEMRNELTRGARTVLSPYGVRVLDCYVSDFTETKVFTHEGSGLAIEEYDE